MTGCMMTQLMANTVSLTSTPTTMASSPATEAQLKSEIERLTGSSL